MLLLLLILACQGPLGDRHQLDGTRIAAMRVSPPGGPAGTVVQPTAIVTVDGSLWSDESPQLQWYWVAPDEAAVSAIDPDDTPAATGPAPALEIPSSDRRLVLLVDAGGQQLRAFIDLEAEPPTMPSLTNVVVTRIDDENLATIEGTSLDLEHRLEWSNSASNTFQPGDILRFEAIPSSTGKELRTRWSATAPYGTFFELDPMRTDWIAGELSLDDTEIEQSAPAPEGGLSILSLLLNDRGGTDYRITDIHLGTRPDGFRTNGRWMTTDSSISPTVSLVAGRLVADDDSTSGLRLEEAQALTEAELPDTDPYGVEALDCAGINSEPFDPLWLAEHRCTREQVIGHSVVLRAQ
jgi:hypothetical protein